MHPGPQPTPASAPPGGQSRAPAAPRPASRGGKDQARASPHGHTNGAAEREPLPPARTGSAPLRTGGRGTGRLLRERVAVRGSKGCRAGGTGHAPRGPPEDPVPLHTYGLRRDAEPGRAAPPPAGGPGSASGAGERRGSDRAGPRRDPEVPPRKRRRGGLSATRMRSTVAGSVLLAASRAASFLRRGEAARGAVVKAGPRRAAGWRERASFSTECVIV